MRGVVHDERTGQRHLHGALGRLGPERGHHRIRAHEQLSAETAADVGESSRTFSFGTPRILARLLWPQAIIWFEVQR